jgi:hypothetical protein
MTVKEVTREQIYKAIEALPEERLPELLRFLEGLVRARETLPADAVPLYQVHRHAISTGVPDLAHQHDHYLYGLEKRDA